MFIALVVIALVIAASVFGAIYGKSVETKIKAEEVQAVDYIKSIR